MSVCLSAHISKKQMFKLHKIFSVHVPVAVAWSYSDDNTIYCDLLDVFK